jgi:transcriptional regulator with XRE-family HTH domain
MVFIMKDRILAFLQSENKSAAQFAEEIGVQPSGISHILSGRNNPSLDFVMKMLHRYSSLSAEWLLFGRGAMYKYTSQPTLFDIPPSEGISGEAATDSTELTSQPFYSSESPETSSEAVSAGVDILAGKEKTLTKVLLFYSDKSCSEYTPS